MNTVAYESVDLANGLANVGSCFVDSFDGKKVTAAVEFKAKSRNGDKP